MTAVPAIIFVQFNNPKVFCFEVINQNLWVVNLNQEGNHFCGSNLNNKYTDNYIHKTHIIYIDVPA